MSNTLEPVIQLIKNLPLEDRSALYRHLENLKKDDDETANSILNICKSCLLYTSPSPRDRTRSRMPSSA